jgi:hypothetical protein
VDGAPDGQAGSHRRLLGRHRPDRHRRAGGGLHIGGWEPDRRRRSPLGRHLGRLDRRVDAAGSEARLASFTELVATAIANAASSAELAASRRRIVAASDDARRRIERDLHDGCSSSCLTGAGAGGDEADPPTETRSRSSWPA